MLGSNPSAAPEAGAGEGRLKPLSVLNRAVACGSVCAPPPVSTRKKFWRLIPAEQRALGSFGNLRLCYSQVGSDRWVSG